MDENKLKLLKEIEYKGLYCCGNCTYSQFKIGSDFGTCSKHIYEHLKHSSKKRELSIYRYAKCKYIKPQIKEEEKIFLDYME